MAIYEVDLLENDHAQELNELEEMEEDYQDFLDNACCSSSSIAAATLCGCGGSGEMSSDLYEWLKLQGYFDL